jgi:HlyD family secretion protein
MRLRTILIVLIIVAAAAAGGYWYYQQQTNSARAATATRSTATITRGTLVASVSGAGNVYAPQQTALSFQLTGVTITKVNVHVGDRVKAGDVLAQVDDTDLQLSLKTATANLTSAQAKLDALKQPPNEADVAAARASVASAQSAYNAAVAKNAHNADQITVAKASLDKAIITLQQAQAAFDRIAWRSDAGNSSQAATLQQATIDYQSALASYNLTLVTINDSAVKSAAQTLASAKANLASVTASATEQELAQAQASVDSAQVAVEQAQRKLDQAKIIAPFDGTLRR